jgi:hypothetical protein
MVLTPLEIVFNKSHPSILLHITDATTRKVLILFLQEIKWDIIYRRAQLKEPRRREELHPRIQAHLISVINTAGAVKTETSEQKTCFKDFFLLRKHFIQYYCIHIGIR